MRRFVLQLLAFVALQGAIAAWVLGACPRPADHYAAATGDKRRRLEGCAQPRIVFVGGSSVAFGFDSRVAVREGFNPVNMGHNRSLGLRFMLGQVRAELQPGDLVVVSPEYELLWKAGVDSTLINHLEYDPASLAAVDVDTGRRLLDKGLPWLSRKLRCAAHQVSTAPPIAYNRQAFDETGDFASHRGTAPTPFQWSASSWPEPHEVRLDAAIEQLAGFAASCEAAGARCVFAFSPLRQPQFEANAATVRHVAAQVEARAGLEVVLSLDDALHPARDYFDAGPHLLPEAATARTERLMRSL